MAGNLNTVFAGSVPDNYDRYLGPMLFEPFALDLASRLKDMQPKNVLKIACGTGRVTKHLAKIIDGHGELIATDLNADMIEIARAKVDDPSVSWLVADAMDLPFEDETFDLIVCQFGVMFFPDKLKAFREAFRLLKPNGTFLFNTWDDLEHNEHSMLVQVAVRKVMRDDAPDFLRRGPFSFFDKGLSRQLLTDAGFQDMSLDTVELITHYDEKEAIMKGLMEGSPLANFIGKLDHSLQNKLKKAVLDEIEHTFGPEEYHEFPMQAIVVEAVKKGGNKFE